LSYLSIKGGNRLSGKIDISGAKNSALPLITASILAKNDFIIDNIPNVSDVNILLNLIKNLGGEYEFKNNKVKINTNNMHHIKAVYDIVKTMRASILVLGPLLARFGEAMVSLPGGCAIGERPVDLHLKALEKMGAIIKIESGYIHAIAPNNTLKGAEIIFDKITVTKKPLYNAPITLLDFPSFTKKVPIILVIIHAPPIANG
jgi:UDP-N-acetylglucosamine 1-carboxyvinyltransferase